MPVLEGREFYQDELLSVSRQICIGAQTAPQVTNKTEIETAIVYGKDELQPFVEILEAIGEGIWAIRGEADNLKKVIDQSLPFALVLIGARTGRSDLNYDCSACGFRSCAEFNRYTKNHLAFGGMSKGPSCSWKVIDWSISWDVASAIAFSHNLPTRAHTSLGGTAAVLGYLPDCDNIGAISLGPISAKKGRVWEYWYSRDSGKDEKATQEDFFANYVGALPSFWVAGPALGDRSYVKHTEDFQTDARHFSHHGDPEVQEKYRKIQAKIEEILRKHGRTKAGNML